MILRKQKQLADKLVLVDELKEYNIKGIPNKIYNPLKMQKRNEYMCNNADYLIAIWDGSSGGTKNCVDYYRQNKNLKNLILINPKRIS
jgi:uncharacterized phage-like protein YoqJ